MISRQCLMEIFCEKTSWSEDVSWSTSLVSFHLAVMCPNILSVLNGSCSVVFPSRDFSMADVKLVPPVLLKVQMIKPASFFDFFGEAFILSSVQQTRKSYWSLEILMSWSNHRKPLDFLPKATSSVYIRRLRYNVAPSLFQSKTYL